MRNFADVIECQCPESPETETGYDQAAMPDLLDACRMLCAMSDLEDESSWSLLEPSRRLAEKAIRKAERK
jgi:hypothetical protein